MKEILFKSIYSFIKSSSFPYFSIIRKRAIIFFYPNIKPSYVGERVNLIEPRKIKIKKGSTLNNDVTLYGNGHLNIGANVLIGHNTSIITSDHNFDDLKKDIKLQGLKFGSVIINDNVWIGCNVTILKGVTIGSGSIIAACSLVNKDVPSGVIVSGVPAKILKHR